MTHIPAPWRKAPTSSQAHFESPHRAQLLRKCSSKPASTSTVDDRFPDVGGRRRQGQVDSPLDSARSQRKIRLRRSTKVGLTDAEGNTAEDEKAVWNGDDMNYYLDRTPALCVRLVVHPSASICLLYCIVLYLYTNIRSQSRVFKTILIRVCVCTYKLVYRCLCK